MAVPEQTPFIEYTANGTTTNFALTFDCDNSDYLIVTLNGVDASVGSWSLVGTSIVFTTAPLNGVVVAIKRDTPLERTTDYQLYDNSFLPTAVNKDFDRIWRKLQELGYADWLLNNKIDQEILDRIASDEEILDYILNQDNTLKADYIARDAALKDYIDQMIALVTGDPSFTGITANFVIDDSGKTQQEINSVLIDGYAYVEWFGDTSTDATNAINLCLLYCKSNNKTAKGIPNKTYNISDTVLIQSSVDFSKCTIVVPSSLAKPAIKITNRGTGLTHLRDKEISLPVLTNNRVLGIVPTIGSIGVQVLGGVRNCNIAFDSIYGFEENLQLLSDTTNDDEFIAYNRFTFNGLFAGSKVNVHMWIANTGWVNQCTWMGGQFAGYSQDRATFSSVNLKISKTTSAGNNPPNGHTFFGCSMEGNFTQTIEYNLHADVTTSYYSLNTFVNCRFESSVSMKLSSYALYDTFIGCYGLYETTYVNDVRPTILGSARTGHVMLDVAVIAGAADSRTAKNTVTYSAGNSSSAIPLTVGFNKIITGGLQASGSYVMFHPTNSALLHPLCRVALDTGSPSILMGDGSSAPSEKLFRYAANDWRHTFNLRPNADITQNLGSAALRYKEMHVQDLAIYPPSSNAPTTNGEVTFELTSNTQLKIYAKGSDGVVRSGTITLA